VKSKINKINFAKDAMNVSIAAEENDDVVMVFALAADEKSLVF
jgi:hypothetical protein